MTTAAEIARKVSLGYFEVSLQRRLPDGTYEADWTDISRYVTGGGKTIDYSIDSADFDIGIITITKVDLTLNNRDGRFNDVDDSRSLWSSFESRHLSRMKIEAGYLDKATLVKIPETIFVGLTNDQAFQSSGFDDMGVTLLAREYAFKTLDVIAGTFSSAVTVTEAIIGLCTRSEILAHMTVDVANIAPGNDIVIDNPGAWATKKLNDVLTEIMLLSNSVMYVDGDDNLIVRNRDPLPIVAYQFRLNASDGKADNLYSLTNYSNGRQRVKNAFVWGNDTTLSASSSDVHQARYGVTRKTVSSDAVTNTAVIQSVLDELRDEWQFPKNEFEVETDYLANEVFLFDLVTLDVQPSYDRQDNLPICGVAVAGTDRCASFKSGLKIDPTLGFKIISLRHDLAAFKTYLKVRLKGNQLNDGYVSMVITKNVAVTFTASASQDLDVSVYGMNAQKTMVQELDSADSYRTNELDVTRPSTSIVRLTAGAAITKTFRILLVQVED